MRPRPKYLASGCAKYHPLTDAAGNIVPARTYATGWGDQVTVLFKAAPETADYLVYYGNPKAEQSSMNWPRSAYPILMVTVPVAFLTFPKRIVGSFRGAACQPTEASEEYDGDRT